MDINSKEKGSVYATNPPSNSTWSFKGEYPIASFEIAAQNKWLDPRSLRLNGEFRIKSPLDTGHASRSWNAARACNETTSFSIPLRTGLLSGGELLPLGQNGLRGLNISLELAPDSQVISGYRVYAPDNTETPVLFTPINTGAYYELENLQLTYDLLVPSDEAQAIMAAPATGSLSYNSFSQLYSVINASEQTQNFNFGVSNCLAVTHNFIPTNQINNYNFDGFSTDLFKNQTAGVYNTTANLDRLTFGRNGIKLPYDFEFDEADAAAANRPQVERIDALKGSVNVRNSARTSISVGTENALLTKVNLNGDEVALLNPAVSVETQSKPVFASGTNLDNISHVGRDYSTAVYSVRFETELDGASPNSINTYSLAKNVLTYSPSGISVSS